MFFLPGGWSIMQYLACYPGILTFFVEENNICKFEIAFYIYTNTLLPQQMKYSCLKPLCVLTLIHSLYIGVLYHSCYFFWKGVKPRSYNRRIMAIMLLFKFTINAVDTIWSKSWWTTNLYINHMCYMNILFQI